MWFLWCCLKSCHMSNFLHYIWSGCCKLPIIYLYCLWFVDFESSSFLNLQLVCIGVVTSLQSSIPNLFSISLIYLVWEIKIMCFLWHIWRPKNKDSSPSNDISNSLCISFANFWLNLSLVLPKQYHQHKFQLIKYYLDVEVVVCTSFP